MRGTKLIASLSTIVLLAFVGTGVFAAQSNSSRTAVQIAGTKAQSAPQAPKKKITLTCLPGHKDYSPDQCYKDIKGK